MDHGRKSEPARYFLDTEFHNNAEYYGVDLISLAVVAESPTETIRTYYAQNVEFDFDRETLDLFVREHVLPSLLACPSGRERGDHLDNGRCSRHCPWRTPDQLRSDLLSFIVPEGHRRLELWGDCAGFDYVVLSQLMGTFDDWPKDWPMFIHEISQYRLSLQDRGVRTDRPADMTSARSRWVEAFPHLADKLPQAPVRHNALLDVYDLLHKHRWLRSCDPSFKWEAQAAPASPPSEVTDDHENVCVSPV